MLNQLKDQLVRVFLRYYDTAYGLRDTDVMAERRTLLEGGATLLQEPFIELLPDWLPAEQDLMGSCADLDVPQFHELLSVGLLDGVSRLYEHQDAALRSSLAGQH